MHVRSAINTSHIINYYWIKNFNTWQCRLKQVKPDQHSSRCYTCIRHVTDLHQQLLQDNNYPDRLLCEISSELPPVEFKPFLFTIIETNTSSLIHVYRRKVCMSTPSQSNQMLWSPYLQKIVNYLESRMTELTRTLLAWAVLGIATFLQSFGSATSPSYIFKYVSSEKKL